MPRAPIRHGALQDLKWFHSTVREVDGDRLLIHFMVGRARRTACRASSSAYERGVRHCAGLGRTVGRQHGALEREYPGQLARARIRSGCKRRTTFHLRHKYFVLSRELLWATACAAAVQQDEELEEQCPRARCVRVRTCIVLCHACPSRRMHQNMLRNAMPLHPRAGAPRRRDRVPGSRCRPRVVRGERHRTRHGTPHARAWPCVGLAGMRRWAGGRWCGESCGGALPRRCAAGAAPRIVAAFHARCNCCDIEFQAWHELAGNTIAEYGTHTHTTTFNGTRRRRKQHHCTCPS